MTLNRKRFLGVVLAVGLLGAATGGAVGAMKKSQDARVVHASWVDVYERPGAMVRDVDAIVVARFLGATPGRVATGSAGESIPFELAKFAVERSLKGTSAATVTVERVGGVAGGQQVVFESDGGSYTAGQRYVLFLKRQPGTGYYYLVNDQGRYTVTPRGLAPAAHHGAVADRLRGASLAGLDALVARTLGR
ncbi:MAG TPA: hypothetical protein VHJ34_01650 [Actinomycetota bacterium]|nr:hypothetical protein [Actinomycetota bacterium]